MKKRNRKQNFQYPLNLEYSCEIRESLINDHENPADFRGVINLVMLFTAINYLTKMIKNYKSYGLIFIDYLVFCIKEC